MRKITRANTQAQVEADEMAGFHAFPSVQYTDHLRGLRSYVTETRCPYKRPERRAAWERGYLCARDAIVAAFEG
jgi:ribosome modulation factor